MADAVAVEAEVEAAEAMGMNPKMEPPLYQVQYGGS
jgi:hypothetical protein